MQPDRLFIGSIETRDPFFSDGGPAMNRDHFPPCPLEQIGHWLGNVVNDKVVQMTQRFVTEEGLCSYRVEFVVVIQSSREPRIGGCCNG